MRPGFPGGLTFEVDPTGMPAGPGMGGEPEPVEPAEPVEQWTPDRDSWEQMQAQNGFLMEQLQQITQFMQPQEQGGIQIPEGSMLEPQDLEVIGQLIQSYVQPFQQTQEQWMQSQGQELALDVIADENAQNGDFLFNDPNSQIGDSRAKAQDLAERYYPQFAQQYGVGARYGAEQQAAEAALRQACADVREWEQAVGKAYMEREQNQLSTLAGAPRSPASVGRPAQQLATVAPGGDEFSILDKFFPRNPQ